MNQLKQHPAQRDCNSMFENWDSWRFHSAGAHSEAHGEWGCIDFELVWRGGMTDSLVPERVSRPAMSESRAHLGSFSDARLDLPF